MKIFSKCSVVFFLLMFFFGNNNSCYGMNENNNNDNDKDKEEIIDEKDLENRVNSYLINIGKKCQKICNDNLSKIDLKEAFKTDEDKNKFDKNNGSYKKHVEHQSIYSYIKDIKENIEIIQDKEKNKELTIMNRNNPDLHLELKGKEYDIAKEIMQEKINTLENKLLGEIMKDKVFLEKNMKISKKEDILTKYEEEIVNVKFKEICEKSKISSIFNKNKQEVDSLLKMEAKGLLSSKLLYFISFIEGFYIYSPISFLRLFTSILFQALIPGFGGHNVYKNIGHNFYLYTSNFPSFTKFLRFGISYKINKMFHLNIFGFNIWKWLQSSFGAVYHLTIIEYFLSLSFFTKIDSNRYKNKEDFQYLKKNIKIECNSYIRKNTNNLLYCFFCMLRCFEISVEYNLAKYYCVRFDILSLILSIVCPLTLDRKIMKYLKNYMNEEKESSNVKNV